MAAGEVDIAVTSGISTDNKNPTSGGLTVTYMAHWRQIA